MFGEQNTSVTWEGESCVDNQFLFCFVTLFIENQSNLPQITLPFPQNLK